MLRSMKPRAAAVARSLSLLALIMILVATRTLAASEPKVLNEAWFILKMQGEPAGWMHSRTSEHAPEDRIVTETEMRIALGRGGVTVKLQMAGRFIETAGGKPVEMWSLQKLATSPTEVTYTFGGDEITVTTRQGDVTSESTAPAPEIDWMTPARAAEHIQEELASGVETITYTTIDPMIGPTPVEISHQIIDRDTTAEITSGRVPAVQWITTQSYMPGMETTELVSPEGELLRSTIDIGGISMEMIAADRATALRHVEAPEIMADTFIRPSRTIRDPRRTERLTLDLRVKGGSMPELPTTAAQLVERTEEGARVEIDVNRRLNADELDMNDPDWLAATRYLNHEDEAVRVLAKRATESLRDDATVAERAEAMRAFVHGQLDKKNLNVGFATASEVARDLAGDCSEHGVLLAAMLRAEGIPARVASGLLYAESFAGANDIFGYHMWTQALIDGAWVDYDATLRNRFDATHITVFTSALTDSSLHMDMSAMLPLFGRLEIDVVDVGY